MFPTAAARNYARAFVDVARGREDLAALAAEFSEFARLVAADRALAAALHSPTIPAGKKQQLIAAVIQSAGGSSYLTQVLSLLAAQGQLHGLAAIDQALRKAVDRELDLVRAEVRVAQPISPEQLEKITAALGRLVGKNVQATVLVDPSLLGGFVARAGDQVFDGSIRRQMGRLRTQLLGGP